MMAQGFATSQIQDTITKLIVSLICFKKRRIRVGSKILQRE